MAKGGNFEREICKALGRWWTGGERDDVFWRSSNSGGRATVRRKSGKRTAGHYGDICATDPIGKPLTDFATIECKRGYTRTSFADVLDRPDHILATPFEKFIEQAQTASDTAGTHQWMLITRRDKKETMLFMSLGAFNKLKDHGCSLLYADLYVRMRVIVRFDKPPRHSMTIIGVRLEEFFRLAKPKHFHG